MAAQEIPSFVLDWLPSLLENTSEHAVIFVAPQDGSVLAWLGAAERLVGYTAAEAVGMKIERLFTPEDLALGLEKQERALACATGRSEDDRWHVRKNGARFWASGVLEAIKAADGSVVALCKVFRDKTDVRTQWETLETRLARSQQGVSEGHETALVKAGHELRNALTPMSNALALLDRSDEPAVRVRAHDILRRQMGLMKTLVDGLTAARRPDNPGQASTWQPVVLQEALRHAVAAWAGLAGERQQVLQAVLPDRPLWIKADPAALQQILANLLSNAIKYTPHGGRVTVSATAEADLASVKFEDSGVGIPPDLLPHVFELFSRGASADTEGLGVGLAVVKELVTRHGGFISARSAGPGQGSIFSLRLPLLRQAHPNREDPLASTAPGAPDDA